MSYSVPVRSQAPSPCEWAPRLAKPSHGGRSVPARARSLPAKPLTQPVGCNKVATNRLLLAATVMAFPDRIEPTAAPEWALNNIIHRFERLPLELVPA